MINLLLSYETKISKLQKEINQLLENERINSVKVYQLSLEIDKLISDYYKNYHKRV